VCGLKWVSVYGVQVKITIICMVPGNV